MSAKLLILSYMVYKNVMHKFGALVPYNAQIGNNGISAVVIQNGDYGYFEESMHEINTVT